jgi:hypothetical protein
MPFQDPSGTVDNSTTHLRSVHIVPPRCRHLTLAQPRRFGDPAGDTQGGDRDKPGRPSNRRTADRINIPDWNARDSA